MPDTKPRLSSLYVDLSSLCTMIHCRFLCSDYNDIFAQYRVPWASTTVSLPSLTPPLLPNYYPRFIHGCNTTPPSNHRPSLQISIWIWTCKRRANITNFHERLHKSRFQYGQLPWWDALSPSVPYRSTPPTSNVRRTNDQTRDFWKNRQGVFHGRQ
jgi:hypothetical protein